MNETELSFLGSIYGHGTSYAGAVWDKEGLCPTINTAQGGNREPMIIEETVKVKQATKKGYIECCIGGCYDSSYPESKLRRGRVQEGGERDTNSD